MPKKFIAAIFDFDGTLVDSGEGIKNSVIYALKKYGITETDRDKLNYFIGPPLFDSFRDIYSVSNEDSDLLVSYYRERYREKGVLESTVYSGIIPLLKNLKKANIKTAICSSKPEEFVVKISESLGMLDLFDCISAVTFKDKNADKTPLLIRAMDMCGVTPSPEVAMIGDRHFDITAAKKLGVTAVGVSYGFGTEEELKTAGADFTAANAEELEYILMKG